RPIAAAITLRSVDTAWFWKIAYDEAFARYSPGVMLTVALTEELAEDPTLARADSCATADHPMIDHIWREQLALCDRLIALRPTAPFMLARRAESLRRAAVVGLKHIRGWFRA
ncbi:MAG TPA: GNAT family N-acetyltransferase, partial [Xanthobacteraceae bacterium]|nr:GNAT family N-acetyltransferase [Xanthobacteraceae bacterium]